MDINNSNLYTLKWNNCNPAFKANVIELEKIVFKVTEILTEKSWKKYCL